MIIIHQLQGPGKPYHESEGMEVFEYVDLLLTWIAALYFMRQQYSDNCCRLIEFFQKFMQNDIEFIRHFHHRGMTAFINKIKFTVWNQLIKLPGHKWRSNSIIVPPY